MFDMTLLARAMMEERRHEAGKHRWGRRLREIRDEDDARDRRGAREGVQPARGLAPAPAPRMRCCAVRACS